MERILLWSVLAFGMVGWLCGLLLAGRAGQVGRSAPSPVTADGAADVEGQRGGVHRPFLLLAATLPFVVLLVTQPSRPPFAAGQGFGRGFFWGGLLALLAGFTLSIMARRGGARTADVALLVAATCSLALVAASVPLLLAGGDTVVDMLVGVAAGWFAVSFTVYAGRRSKQGGPAPSAGSVLALGTGFAATLCAAAALGVYRSALTPETTKNLWSAAVLVLAAGVPFALLLGALPAGVPPLAVRWIASAALLAGLGALLALKVAHEVRVIPIVFAGLLLGPVAWWTLRPARAGDTEASSARERRVRRFWPVAARDLACRQRLHGRLSVAARLRRGRAARGDVAVRDPARVVRFGRWTSARHGDDNERSRDAPHDRPAAARHGAAAVPAVCEPVG
jgi:hypothetical protein